MKFIINPARSPCGIDTISQGGPAQNRMAMNLKEQYEKALRELEAKVSLIRSGDMACGHPIRQGDNYGESCQACGERLAGYGYWGSHRDCLHQYASMGDDSEYEFCMYCEDVRKKV